MILNGRTDFIVFVFMFCFIAVEMTKRIIVLNGILNLRITRKKSRYLIAFLVLMIACTLGMLAGLPRFLTAINLTTMITMQLILIDDRIGKTLFAIAFSEAFVNLADIILSLFIISDMEVYAALFLIAWKMILINSINIWSLGFLTALKKFLGKRVNFSIPIQVYVIVGIICIPTTVILSMLQIYLVGNWSLTYLRILMLSVSAAVIIVAIVVIYIVVLLYHQKQLNDEKKMNASYMELQEDYFKLWNKNNEDIRKFKHDMNSHMAVIYHLAEEQNYESLKKYVSDIIEVKSEWNGIDVGNSVVNGIMNEFQQQAINHEIKMDLIGKLPADIDVKGIDLCIIFSNVLKNAMEANMNTNHAGSKYVNVEIMNWKGRLMIRVVNSIWGKMDVHNLATSKRDHVNHGLGIKSMKSSVEKYDGHINFNANDKEFEVKIVI